MKSYYYDHDTEEYVIVDPSLIKIVRVLNTSYDEDGIAGLRVMPKRLRLDVGSVENDDLGRLIVTEVIETFDESLPPEEQVDGAIHQLNILVELLQRCIGGLENDSSLE